MENKELIEKLELAIASPATPEKLRASMQEELKELKKTPAEKAYEAYKAKKANKEK